MGIFNKERIDFKQPFTEKYRLTITSNVHTGNMPVESKVIIRWEVKVKSIDRDSINMEILTLGNDLVEYNNQIVKSMADMNKIFAGMYSELDLTIDNDYKLKKINNMELLRKKWSRIKSDLENVLSEEPEIVSHVINLNDENFKNPEIIENLICNNEFFQVYFHHVYGGQRNSRRTESKNILNTALLEWEYLTRKSEKEVQGINIFDVEGYLNTHLDKNWVKENYKAFTHLDLEKIKPVITEKGEYQIDAKTGKLVKSFLEKKETVHPQLLHATITYNLEMEGVEKETPKPSVSKPVEPLPYDPRRSFIIDD